MDSPALLLLQPTLLLLNPTPSAQQPDHMLSINVNPNHEQQSPIVLYEPSFLSDLLQTPLRSSPLHALTFGITFNSIFGLSQYLQAYL